nr:inovirus-type Gp2 protein [uncultured Pseudodesulfovibrio sp.]
MNYQSITSESEFNNLPINNGNGQYDCYEMILQKIHERLTWMTNKHCRVLFIRFDLRFPRDHMSNGGNDEISHFFKIMKDNARNAGCEFHFVWVREQKDSDTPHYHCVVLLNGSRVQNYRRFLGEVQRVWGIVLSCFDSTGLVWACEQDYHGNQVKNGTMIERPRQDVHGDDFLKQSQLYNDALRDCFYWSSYLAKTSQKDRTPHGIRRFNASQLK